MDQVYWVIDGELAGRCGPGHTLWEPGALYAGGIRGIVSLDEEFVDEAALAEAGLEHVPAYQPMTLLLSDEERLEFLRNLVPVFRFLDRMRERKLPALVHCYYGCDRTGAVLACHLIHREKRTFLEAVRQVRDAQPSALHATGYLEAVELFERVGGKLLKQKPAQ